MRSASLTRWETVEWMRTVASPQPGSTNLNMKSLLWTLQKIRPTSSWKRTWTCGVLRAPAFFASSQGEALSMLSGSCLQEDLPIGWERGYGPCQGVCQAHDPASHAGSNGERFYFGAVMESLMWRRWSLPGVSVQPSRMWAEGHREWFNFLQIGSRTRGFWKLSLSHRIQYHSKEALFEHRANIPGRGSVWHRARRPLVGTTAVGGKRGSRKALMG